MPNWVHILHPMQPHCKRHPNPGKVDKILFSYLQVTKENLVLSSPSNTIVVKIVGCLGESTYAKNLCMQLN